MAVQTLSYGTSPFTQLRVYTILCDTVSDLPSGTYDGVSISQGWTAKIIENGASYLSDSSGAWVLQPSTQSQIILPDVYSEAETDALLTSLETRLKAQMYMHTSTQVNLNDVTWTRSGGGMYYSSTITIPDSTVRLLYHATLSGFSNLRATDVITPAVRRSGGWTGFVLYANTNSFLTSAWVTVSVSGLP